MATKNTTIEPIASTEGTSPLYWDRTSESLPHFIPSEQDQAWWFGQFWATEFASNSDSMASLPAGLFSSHLRPYGNAKTNVPDWQRARPFELSSINQESSTSYESDRSLSSPTTLPERFDAIPSKVAKVLRRRRQPGLPSKRKSHNEIEARYRETINTALKALQQVISTPIFVDDTTIYDQQQQNTTKAAVIIRAVAYIKQLEAGHYNLIQENEALHSIINHSQNIL